MIIDFFLIFVGFKEVVFLFNKYSPSRSRKLMRAKVVYVVFLNILPIIFVNFLLPKCPAYFATTIRHREDITNTSFTFP